MLQTITSVPIRWISSGSICSEWCTSANFMKMSRKLLQFVAAWRRRWSWAPIGMSSVRCSSTFCCGTDVKRSYNFRLYFPGKILHIPQFTNSDPRTKNLLNSDYLATFVDMVADESFSMVCLSLDFKVTQNFIQRTWYSTCCIRE